MLHHVVGTYDGARVTLYVDALPVATNDQSGNILNYDQVNGLAIGASNTSQSGNHFVFDGTINEVAVYDHALSVQRIQAHYLAGLPDNPDQ